MSIIANYNYLIVSKSLQVVYMLFYLFLFNVSCQNSLLMQQRIVKYVPPISLQNTITKTWFPQRIAFKWLCADANACKKNKYKYINTDHYIKGMSVVMYSLANLNLCCTQVFWRLFTRNVSFLFSKCSGRYLISAWTIHLCLFYIITITV